jgi:hypothetical protein
MPDRAPFPTFVAVDVFSELFGFVLLSPDDLDAHYARQARGRDLLHEYTSTDEGDRVAAEGIAVPVLGIPADDYTLVVRHVDAASTLTDGAFESRGWVLHATATPLCLCGLGYLTRWDPDHPRVLRPRVPPGWYVVTIRGGEDAARARTIELVLEPREERPTFRGDPTKLLDFEV